MQGTKATNLGHKWQGLDAYQFTCQKFLEADGSVTLSLNEVDLIENAPTEQKAKLALAQSMLEYAQDYYEEFPLWNMAPNRKSHLPYVFKALMIEDSQKLAASIRC